MTAFIFVSLLQDGATKHFDEIIARREGTGRRAEQIAGDLQRARTMTYLTNHLGTAAGELTPLGKWTVFDAVSAWGDSQVIEVLGIGGWKHAL